MSDYKITPPGLSPVDRDPQWKVPKVFAFGLSWTELQKLPPSNDLWCSAYGQGLYLANPGSMIIAGITLPLRQFARVHFVQIKLLPLSEMKWVSLDLKRGAEPEVAMAALDKKINWKPPTASIFDDDE